MKDLLKQNNQQKHQFKAKDCCANCQQQKSCGLLDEKKKYCCPCYQGILEEVEKNKLLIDSAQQTLNDYRQENINCQCLKVEKPQVKYINSDGSGWINCEGAGCEKIISSAGHHRTIRNRNDPRFWGLEVKKRVLCLKCLGNLKEKMPVSRRYTFNKYVKRGYE